MERILELLKPLLAILPFLILCLRNRKVNMPSSDRSRQYPMAVIAILYSVVCMIYIDSITSWLFDFINNIPLWISNLATKLYSYPKLVNMLSSISSFFTRLINAINLKYWIFYIANFVILAAYLILKRLAIAIISRVVKHDGKLHTRIASLFYEYFFERNLWCLKEGYSQVRSYLKTFYYTAIALSSILLIASVEMFRNGMLQAAFYPVFSIILVGELWFYLGGVTQKEYSTVLGEDDEAYRIANYSILRKFLRSLFKDKLLAENTDLNSALSYGVTSEDILNELEKDEDPKITCMAAYFKALHQSGFVIDHNYLQSTADLLNGKSILFNNPFYKDMIPYAFYPINRTLLSHKKVLVILGRHAIEDDVAQWLEDGIASITNIPSLWNVTQLTDKPSETIPDIGIVTRSNVLNIKMQDANADFFKNVGFVVILEPSKLITTAQIGLNVLIRRCGSADSLPTYCMCDKNCDGLVDAMSHILMTNITEVAATNKHTGTSSYMCWEADGEFMQHRMLPNISRYLGFGTELSFAALKNQVAKTEWYGGEAFPVTDMQWISRQYYYDLTKYAGLPTNQESMSEYFKTSPNFWSAEQSERNYFTVEDEAFNMFEILRGFSTRTTSQGFINVISQDYLLREYMAENAPIFETDPKAIPYIAADHARTVRNSVLKLLLLMSSRPVGANVIEKEFSMLGIPVYNLTSQLWLEIYKCYASVDEIAELGGVPYEAAVDLVANRRIRHSDFDINRNVLVIKNGYDIEISRMQESYSITDKRFIESYISTLRSASYIAEDEKGETNFLGAEICGHVYQKYLPGQFFTFGGKYYEMQNVTHDNQVLLRRAADHINGRPSYRQLRDYCFNGFRKSDTVGAVREISGMKISLEYADFVVNTKGYYNLKRYNDLATAQLVTFPEGIPERRYFNKPILRIDLPDSKNNANIRYTVALLFNEIFRTLFAENHAYICAVTSKENTDGARDPLTYSLSADGCELDNSSIYVVEDSQLDLGLLVAVERNLSRIFEIMYEYLDWHEKTLAESLGEEPEAPDNISFAPVAPKKSILRRLIDRVKRLFGRKKGKKDPEAPENPENPEPPENPEAPKKRKGVWGKVKDFFKRRKKKRGKDEPDETPADTDTTGEPDETPADTDTTADTPKGSDE